METKHIDSTALAGLRRDRTIEGETGIWMKVSGTKIHLLTLAATDANPAFVDLFPKMQAELRRLDGVGAEKAEIEAVRARYYVRMFLRDWKGVPAARVDGRPAGQAPWGQEAAAEFLVYCDDAMNELAETVFEPRRFRLALAKEITEDLKN